MHDVTSVLTAHYNTCLAAHGPTARGMDWGENEARLRARFDTICRAIEADRPGPPINVLDAGCGCGLLLDHLAEACPRRVEYIGLDASAAMIEAAHDRHPEGRWVQSDILDAPVSANADWVVANGLLTERRTIDEPTMTRYARQVIERMYDLCSVGIVFNVMTSHVNYCDESLYYCDPGEMIEFLVGALSRHIVLFHDLESYDVFYCVRREPWSHGH